MDDYAANVVPGSGAVIRWEAGIVLAGGQGDAPLDLIADLQARLGPQPPSGAIVDLLRSGLAIGTSEVALAAAVTTPEGLRVFVRGGAQVRTETNELIAGPELTERDLSSIDALWLGLVDPPASQGHPAMDMRRGVVTGSGVVLHRTEPVAEARPDASLAHPAASQTPQPPAAPASPGAAATIAEPVGGFDAIDWDRPSAAEAREPLAILTVAPEDDGPTPVATEDQILGIRCSRNHFNNPKAGYCQVCGISMVHLTHRLEPGARPTLGFVVFADGATYAVDRPYLIGRSPTPASGGDLTPLATQDATQSVSREHAELRLDGWDIKYVDIGSTNGSFLWNVDRNRWDPIPANMPVILESGATVSVGRMTFVFQAASRAVGAA